jgi:hypothetical protein
VNGRLLGLLAWLVVFPAATPALAWSDVGHPIIREIAFQELNETRTREHPTEQL